jgi:hypothetical protein
MASWYLVPCLKTLFAEFDRIAPSRDHTSDGSIGDTAHQAEASDHNPDSKGAVHAIDVDSDLHAAFTMENVIQFFVAQCRKNNPNGTDRGRLKYFIYNRRIWSASTGWKQETYTGSSPHTEHAHFSCEYAATYENDTNPWGLIPQFGDDVSEQDVTNALNKFFARTDKAVTGHDPVATSKTGVDVWFHGIPNGQGYEDNAYAVVNDLAGRIIGIQDVVNDLSDKVDEIAQQLTPPTP